MIRITEKIKALFATFDQSGRAVFRGFLAHNPQIAKRYISVDFCLHNEDWLNNVFCFSFIPYDATLVETKDEIQKSTPKDWKKLKIIPTETIEFLRDKRCFHIALILPRVPQVFYNGEGSDPLAIARESVSVTVDTLIGQGCTGDSLHRPKALKRESKANRFNITPLSNLYLLSDFFRFVTPLLARERSIEVAGWLPDRDKMTTWCEGAVSDTGVQNLMGLAEHFRIAIPDSGPITGVPTPDAGRDAMWYDEFVRSSDYVAGILVAWNFETNQIPTGRIKYRIIAQDFAVFARNIMVSKIRYDTRFQSSQIVSGKESIAAQDVSPTVCNEAEGDRLPAVS